MIGLSNSPINNLQLTTTVQPASVGVPRGLSASLYGDNLSYFTNEAQAGGGTLYYPLDSPKYIFTMTISQYIRTTLTGPGTFQSVPNYPGIVLPLPTNMLDTDSVTWEDVALGSFTGPTLSNLGALAAIPAALFGGGLGTIFGNVGANAAAVTGALTGVAPNQFVTMLFRGPRYKRHHFNWSFAPHNFREAQQLQQIITILRNAMAPGFGLPLGNAPLLWTYPYVFYIRLYPNSGFMYKFKPAVLSQLSVNYTPAGKGSFLRDGAGPGQNSGNNPPSVVQIQMEFIEIEFWTQGNYENSNNPDQSVTYGNATVPTAGQASILNAPANVASAATNVWAGTNENFSNNPIGTNIAP